MRYLVKHDPGDPTPGLYREPDRKSLRIARISPGETVEVNDLEQQEEDDPLLSLTWLQVSYRLGTLLEERGWFERKYIDFEEVRPHEPEEFDEEKLQTFVRECAQAERVTRELNGIENGGVAPLVVLADYLIALALIETNLERMHTQLPGTDAIGPFQITSQEWEEFRATGPGSLFDPIQRFNIVAQIHAAQFLTQRDWRSLVNLTQPVLNAAGGNSDDTYVPTFLNLLHARLLGPRAAVALNTANSNPVTTNDHLEAVLATTLTPAELKGLKERRGQYFTAMPPLSVSGFFNNTAKLLRDSLTSAFSLFKTHYPAFATLPAATHSPWMDIAETERVKWEPPAGLEETSEEGRDRIVNDYFRATDHHPAHVEHWCGAFAAWCLANSGNAAARASVFPGAARAANWKTWGTTEIRPGSIKQLGPNQLFGAVVVLHPGTGTGTSGHVCFALSRINEKLECIGGNQSNIVRRSSYEISRIAAIRVLEVPKLEAVADGDISQATIDMIKGFEGLRLESYQDLVQKWTIGYGTTTSAGIGVTVGPGMTITEPEAEEFLIKGLTKFAAEIKPAISRDYTSNQFGAMLSLAYNIGTPRFKTSTCLERFNSGDLVGAAEALTWWNKAGGIERPGLISRRARERAYFLSG